MSLSDGESDFSDFDQLENQGTGSNANSETIASLLEQLSNNLYQYDVHAQYIRALRQAALYDELKEAREMMHSIFPLSEEMWREWIEDESRIASTKEEKQKVIHLYSKAVQDYLSIDLWKEYTSYVVQEYKNNLNKMELDGSESEFIVTLDQVRKIFDEANRETCYHITKSHQIWDAYRDFESEILEASYQDEQKNRVRKMYENRLKIPHATIEKTFSDYSSFITKYDNSNYENIMKEMSKYVDETKTKYYERDSYENALTASENTLDKFMDYIEFEKDQKKPVVNAIRTLYERAVAIYYLDHTLWEDYILFLIDKYLADKKTSISILMETAERSVRNCSWSGDLWSHYISILEKNFSPSEEVANIFNRALSIGMLKNNIDDLIKVIISNADYERRKIIAYKGSINQENYSSLVNFLKEGIRMVKETFQTGDLYYRLEKYLIEIETLTKNLPKAKQIWDELSKNHRNESEFWIRYADWEKTVGNLDEARKIYKKASQQNSDWPERIFDAWEQFEHHHGTVDSLKLAIIFIKKQVKVVARRRERAALREAQDAQNEGISQIFSVDESNYIPSEHNTKKRKSEEDEQQQTEGFPKKSRAQQFEKPKRDRESATIVVSNLPLNIREGELKTFFHKCGNIKEIRFLEDKVNTQKTAYIEFNEKESVLAALTKDKKKIGDQEIDVCKISECTLYITNFSPSVDMKELFKKYGEIISVRMPNLKYRKRGAFCYVEFKEKNSAQAALEMNGYELEPGKKIKVMISNPSFKKERSPPIQTEVYVRNLPSNVDRGELKSLFQTYGPVAHVRIPTTVDRKGKGIAFVEFKNEEHAKASLVLNSTEFKGFILDVSLSETDRKHSQKDAVNEHKTKEFRHKQELKESEKRSKTVAFTKLSKDTTEENIREMLSQNFKDEAISKITMIPHDRRAYVEFDHIEDAGKAVLHFNKYKLNNTLISAVDSSDLPSTPVQREGKPAKMIPRKLAAPSSKFGTKKKPGVGSGLDQRFQTGAGSSSSSSKEQLTRDQDTEMKDKNISKKSNNDFKALFYNSYNG